MDPLFLKQLLKQNLENNPNQDLNAQPNQNLNYFLRGINPPRQPREGINPPRKLPPEFLFLKKNGKPGENISNQPYLPPDAFDPIKMPMKLPHERMPNEFVPPMRRPQPPSTYVGEPFRGKDQIQKPLPALPPKFGGIRKLVGK
jgi:hypothetical protein